MSLSRVRSSRIGLTIFLESRVVMGKRIRVWIIRLVAVFLVVFMIASLFSNMFTNRSSSSDKEQTTQTSKSKYKYVSSKNQVKLDGVNQVILLPENVSEKDHQTDEEYGSVSYNYGSVQIDNDVISVMITKMESENGGNFGNMSMVTKDEMAQVAQSEESEDTSYYSFQGDDDEYMEVIKTIPSEESSYSYQVSYCIYDTVGINYYMITLYLTSPSQPSKTDMLQVDNFGKEMMAKTRYIHQTVTSEFTVPDDNLDLFNH